MNDIVTKDAGGNIVLIQTFDDAGNLMLEYDFVANTVTNHSDVPDEEKVVPLTPEVKAHFLGLTNKRTIEEKLQNNIAAMQALFDELDVLTSTPNSQITIDPRFLKQSVLRPMKDICKNLKILNREVLNSFDGED